MKECSLLEKVKEADRRREAIFAAWCAAGWLLVAVLLVCWAVK